MIVNHREIDAPSAFPQGRIPAVDGSRHSSTSAGSKITIGSENARLGLNANLHFSPMTAPKTSAGLGAGT